MGLRRLLLVMGLTLAFAVRAENISISAEPGTFNAKTLGTPSAQAMVSASFRLTAFDGARGWPPAAYVGFHQGPDRNNSFQFLIIRNTETDSYVVAGYRVMEDGCEVKQASLENLPLGAASKVRLSFANGNVRLVMDGGSPVSIRTRMTEVSPYVSVSSGSAEFIIEP